MSTIQPQTGTIVFEYTKKHSIKATLRKGNKMRNTTRNRLDQSIIACTLKSIDMYFNDEQYFQSDEIALETIQAELNLNNDQFELLINHAHQGICFMPTPEFRELAQLFINNTADRFNCDASQIMPQTSSHYAL